MLEATDTEACPVAYPALRRQEASPAQLHLAPARQIPYKKLPQEKIELPKRSKKGAYDDRAALKERKFVPEKY